MTASPAPAAGPEAQRLLDAIDQVTELARKAEAIAAAALPEDPLPAHVPAIRRLEGAFTDLQGEAYAAAMGCLGARNAARVNAARPDSWEERPAPTVPDLEGRDL